MTAFEFWIGANDEIGATSAMTAMEKSMKFQC